MDAIRVSKVERVECTKSGSTALGTIHLTAHHLIFRYDDGGEQEMWVPYPLISLVTRLPQTLQGQCPLTFHTRTFETFSLAFPKEKDASDVFDSVKELTVAPSVNQLYAFFYTPNPPFPARDGWSIYSARDEFGRMGVGTRTKAWRFTDINKDYSFCSTYPARLVVPTKISDTTLQYASRYRSKCRIPVLTYFHWANYGTITRSSQPMVGLTQNRSIQDEKLIEAIFQSHHSPDSRTSNTPVYGATSTNLIIDARPTTNAVANTAKGAGTENMDHYREGKKAYLGIDNIHIMRESLGRVIEALREADTLLASINQDLPEQLPVLAVLDRQALRRSGWLRHISAIIEGTILITRNIHVNSSHVLIHCSDGWDRTAQLSSLSQLCLDPYYRTIRGFEILIEKDWLSYGHKFLDRSGHLSSDKFFISSTEMASAGSGADAAQAFLASVQNRFVSQNHIKETSPVFHQFLETVRQVQRQFPERFEFNQRFLHKLYYHLYSCQFGTFLYNCERERKVGDGAPPPCDLTVSVWDFFNSPSELEKNLNLTYDPSLDDPKSRAPKADMGVLFPNPKDVRFWHELYGRTDEEMNGRPISGQARGAEVIGLVEGSDDDPVTQRSSTPTPLSPPQSPAVPISPSRSMTLALPSQRSASPGLAAMPPDLYGSMPEVPTPPTGSGSTPPHSSALLSRQSPSTSPSPSPRSQPSSSRGRTKPPDFLASTGVKSMWGKFSSNASAAFTVVQEAYVGAAKDLRNTGSVNDAAGKTAELRGREVLNAWGDEQHSLRSPSTLSAGSGSNPWASLKSSPSMPSGFLDNPWGSVRANSEEDRPTLADVYQPSSPLPLDPTVAHPVPRMVASPQSSIPRPGDVGTLSNAPSGGMDRPGRLNALAPPRKTPSPQPSVGASDPLGVGLL